MPKIGQTCQKNTVITFSSVILCVHCETLVPILFYKILGKTLSLKKENENENFPFLNKGFFKAHIFNVLELF